MVTMKMKDGAIMEISTFSSSKKKVPSIIKKTYNGLNGVSKIIKIRNGIRWYR